MGMAPFTVAFLLLLVGVEGMSRRDGLMPNAERNQPFLRGGISLHDRMKASEEQGLPEDVPPDFFCHSCQEFSRKAEKFLASPSLYEQANNLSTEVCQIMHSKLEIKCRKLMELYLHEGILFLQIMFGEKNLCNSTGFCPADDSAFSFLTSHWNGHIPSMEPSFVLIRKIGKQFFMQLGSKALSRIEHSPLKEKIKSRTCNACHAAADQITKDLEDHDQQMVIMRRLLDVCEALRNYADRCKMWVFEYGPLFLSNLHKFLMSKDICQTIHMCEEPVPPKMKTLITSI